MHQERRTHARTGVISIAVIFLALGTNASHAQDNYDRRIDHNRYFGTENYGVRAESMGHVMRENVFILRRCAAEVVHRDTVRLFGRNITAFYGKVAVLGQKVVVGNATGRAWAEASLVNGRFTYTPFDVNLREGVEVSPSWSHHREVLSWGQTFWLGFIPVRLEVSAGGVFEVYARRTRVTSRGLSPTIRSTIGASASITGRGFAGLGADIGVLSGRAGVELRLNLAQVSLESPCSVGWDGVDMPVNLVFSNRLMIRLTAQACVFNPFTWSDECTRPLHLTLVDHTFAEHTWQLARFQMQ